MEWPLLFASLREITKCPAKVSSKDVAREKNRRKHSTGVNDVRNVEIEEPPP